MPSDSVDRLGMLLCAALLAGCVAAPSAATPASLLETVWRAVEIDGAPVAGREGTRGPHIVLAAGGRVSGHTGCNALTGGYRLDGSELRFGPLAMTRMACVPDELNRIEAAFVKALNDTVSYRAGGNALQLTDQAGRPRVRLLAGEAH